MKKKFFKSNFTRILFIAGVFLVLCSSWTKAQDFDTDVPVGWAAIPGNGLETTTGGAGGNVVTATSLSELTSYVGSSDPLIILVEGTISGNTMINVASNKTIIGQGSNALLSGVGLSLSSVSNVIIRNLTITGVGVDGIATRSSHHVWIDHCDVSNCGDGAIDITIHSDYHAVSWVRLSNHDKTMLINSGTSQDADIGTLNTTLHHCWWDGTVQRNPRVGYGKVHVFNNLLNDNGSYGIGLHSQCRVLAESNYFDHVPNPIHQMYRDDPADIHHGFCEEVNNIFDNCTGDIDNDGESFPVGDYYMYNFMIDGAANVPSIVKAGAGPDAQFENIGLLPTPGQGAVKVDYSNISWTKGQSATSYIVYFGTTNNPPQVATTSGTSYNVSLSQNTVYYWRVDQVTSSGTIPGKLWVFTTGTGIVDPEPVSGVTVSPSTATVSAGMTVQLNATVLPGNAGNKNVSWSSDNSSVASVNSTGLVTGVAQGTATITVTTEEGGFTATANITVGSGPLEGYSYCSDEGQTCTFSGTVDVAYGADGLYNFVYGISDGSILCDNSTFGDPVSGVAKACYVKQVGTTITYSLSISTNGQGIVSPSSGDFNEGSVILLTATADAGWQFDSWSGDASGSSNPVSITMDGNKMVTANFSETTNPTTITIQENETGFCSVDGSIDNNNDGFTGDGFANTDNASGEGITWSVNIPASGNYNLIWRYANGGTTDRTAQLMVDGSTIVSNVSMPSTGSWSSWTETSAINVNLSAGTKLIRLQATNSSGLGNMDYITLSGGSISAVACAGLKSAAMTTELADKDINFYPVPVENLLNIQFNRELTKTVDVYLYDMTGKIVRSGKAKGLSHTLDMSGLPIGLYTVKISGENLNVTERVVKQ